MGRLEDFPFKVIWKSWAPSKVEIFAWEAAWEGILMLDNVQRRGLAVVNRCYLCMEKEENCGHILLHSGLSRAVWHLLLSLFGVFWVFLLTVKHLLLSWCGCLVGKKSVVGGSFMPFFG